MTTFKFITIGFFLLLFVAATEAQTASGKFFSTQPTKRIYNDHEVILPNYLQYEENGPSQNALKSTVTHNEIQIKWQTKKETNTSHFELQRSIDGQNFEPIETITASGISLKNCNYSTADIISIMNKDALCYRIKAVFINGEETFSTIDTVDQTNTEL